MSSFSPDDAMLGFMFAPNGGYLISTFGLPLRKRSAPVSEYQNLPTELAVEVDKPGTRILSASIYREGLWFLCVYRIGLEILFKNTNRLSSALQDSFDNLKATSQGTKRSPRFVAFGESPGSFCMILNDDETLKLGVPEDCDNILESYNDVLRQNQNQSDGDFSKSNGIALGAKGSWIIHDGGKHFWGGSALPLGLVAALELGERERWSIKAAELSIFNSEEYFLVYQNGKVWYNVHQSFENKLRSVVLTWALMQGLEEVTFTNPVSNEDIAYFELLRKIMRSALKASPPLFNEEVAHYKRQEFDNRHRISDVRKENNQGYSSQKRITETLKNLKFVKDTSKVQVKRSQRSSTRPNTLSYRRLYMSLFLDLATATFPVDSIVWRIFGNVGLSNNLDENAIEEGKQRVRWTCCCGHKLYDDFEVLEPDALQELKYCMNQYGQSDKGPNKRNDNSRAFGTIWTSIKNRFSGSAINSRAPRDTEGQLPANVEVASQAAATRARRKPPSLLCCMPTSISSEGFKLRHEPLDDIATDKELFNLLRKAFYGKKRMLFSLFSIKKTRSIKIVKFMLAPSNFVDVQDHGQSCQIAPCTCLPPSYLVEPSISATYRCEPVVAAQYPPIGVNFLKHQFENPACQGKEETWFYNQVPKWTAGILRAPNGRRVEGWGIQIECELHQRKLKLMMLLFIAVGALIIGLGYAFCTENPDLQTAFTMIAGWIGFGALSFTIL